MSVSRKFRKVKFGDGLTVTDEGKSVIRVDAGGLPPSGSTDTPVDADKVLTADGTGNSDWAFPTVKVDGIRYDEILIGTNLTSTNNVDGTVTLDASGGVSDTVVWMPLFDSDGAVVLDSDGGLIPTLIPI